MLTLVLGSGADNNVYGDIAAVFSLRPFISSDTSIIYGVEVESTTQSTYSIKVESILEILYSMSFIGKGVNANYSIRDLVLNDVLSIYGINLYYAYSDVESVFALKVESGIASKYSVRNILYADVNSTYQLVSYIEVDVESLYDVSTYNTIYKDIRGVYMLYSPTSETIVTNIWVTVNNE